MAPDLANNGNMTTALPLDELQAAAQQAAPIALVPAGDPMVLNNNKPDRAKVNAYRLGVDQMQARSMAAASTKTYCNNLLNIAPARLKLDAQMTMNRPSPVPAVGNNLFTFLAQRFATTFGPNGLNCMGLLNKPNPVNVTTDGNGVAISATITLPNNAGNGNGNGNGNNMGNNNGNGTDMGNGAQQQLSPTP
jgi:hypothetical protein